MFEFICGKEGILAPSKGTSEAHAVLEKTSAMLYWKCKYLPKCPPDHAAFLALGINIALFIC